MITIKKETRVMDIIDKVICNKCKKTLDPNNEDDIMECQEMVNISIHGGPTSVFGDGNIMAANFCQQCAQELFGEYLEDVTSKGQDFFDGDEEE